MTTVSAQGSPTGSSVGTDLSDLLPACHLSRPVGLTVASSDSYCCPALRSYCKRGDGERDWVEGEELSSRLQCGK